MLFPLASLWSSLSDYVQSQLTTNDMFAGIVGGAVVSFILYQIKAFPSYLWNLYTRNFVWKLNINNDSKNFKPAMKFLTSRLQGKTCRLKVQEEKDETILVPGLGLHFFWYRFNLVAVTVEETELQNSLNRKESVQLQVFGFTPRSIFDKLYEGVQQEYELSYHIPKVYDYSGWWSKCRDLPRRSIDQIFLEEGLIESVIADIAKFRISKTRYEERGLFYRRGYLFYGPPGTGKSTIILALANHFNYNVCYLDLSTIKEATDLKYALTRIPTNSILVLEDIDTAGSAVAKRSELPSEDSEGLAKSSEPVVAHPSEKEDGDGLNLSTILQSLDGVFLPDGLLIMATTNHIDKLDPAVIRDGRFDVNFS